MTGGVPCGTPPYVLYIFICVQSKLEISPFYRTLVMVIYNHSKEIYEKMEVHYV